MGNKKGRGKGKGKEEGGDVLKLINKVDHNEKEFLEFVCATPSDEEMNTKFIPQPSFDTPSITWFLDGRNLTKTINPDWAEAWDQFCVFKGLDWFESDFNFQTVEVQKEGIEFMVDFVRKAWRSLMYKKYEYALQKKKKEEDEIDELKRQVEFIEGQTDKGKGKLKIEQAIHGGGESGEGETVDEVKDDEGVVKAAGAEEKEGVKEAKEDEGDVEVAGAEEKEGVKEKVVEVQADWRAAGDDDVGDNTIIEMTDEAKEDKASVEADDTLGFLFTPGSLVAFPFYEDRDNMVYYGGPFSLKDWMLKHRSPDSRWLSS
ncbi:uncharacterized protein LOC141698130 [Apium graveolens]|uniref:uncharacterized protein LOC141698130 n=1 Tax=Apium graveolens TaxID=4045 RepID=UPI003D794789